MLEINQGAEKSIKLKSLKNHCSVCEKEQKKVHDLSHFLQIWVPFFFFLQNHVGLSNGTVIFLLYLYVKAMFWDFLASPKAKWDFLGLFLAHLNVWGVSYSLSYFSICSF